MTILLGACLLPLMCGHPGPSIPVWNHPMDVVHCVRLQEISPPTATEGGFASVLEQMASRTYAAGGTDLLLKKVNYDWSLVVGEAYSCAYRVGTPMTVISAKY
jgi:hypothetical protein